jgi:hypothetical protein
VRSAAAAVILSFLLLGACGYVGPVLPPSPEIPAAVTNLTVVQRGDQIEIAFATPPRTTDSLAIREFSNIDLRVGQNVVPFDFNHWAASAKPYEVELPPANDRDDPQPHPVSLEIPVAEWQGQHVAIAVRTSTRKKDHFSAWSNRVVLDILAPLPSPEVHAEPTAKGIYVSWKASPDTRYEVFRQARSDKTPVDLGPSGDSFFLDANAQYDTPYAYTVVAKSGAAESLPSKPFLITAIDKFPPSVPASITALAGPSSIELSWQRSPESDLQGYYVYRSTNNGPPQRLGNLVNVPTFTDRQVEHGKTYSYRVSAVDQKGNESAKSSVAETSY